ncbi:MAG: hypothetical protein ABI797_00785 [Chloroflexota bacterium]
MPSDPQAWLDTAQLAVSVAGLLVTAWIALIVQRGSSRLSRLEFTRAVRDSWIHIDDLTLRDERLLRLANGFMPHREGASESFGEKRIFLLAYLSPLITEYEAARQGMYGTASREAIEAIKAQVALIVADDDGYWVTQNHGLDPEFMALCRELREATARAAATSA